MKTEKNLGEKVANVNLTAYRNTGSVNYWSTYSQSLLMAEKEILQAISSEIHGKQILDIGVGGGRTTPFLLSISRDYFGIDYSPEMISICRKKYPDVEFMHCDAREISACGRDNFSLVFFSFNGIDCVSHTDRQKIYAEIRKIMAPKGYFLFSSHNLRDFPLKPWQCLNIERGSFLNVTRSVYHQLKGAFNYLRYFRTVSIDEGHAMLLDPGAGFRQIFYYIDPEEQVVQLQNSGFGEVKVFDRSGTELPANSMQLNKVNPVHYLAKRLD